MNYLLYTMLIFGLLLTIQICNRDYRENGVLTEKPLLLFVFTSIVGLPLLACSCYEHYKKYKGKKIAK